jgi:hypothetical protein
MKPLDHAGPGGSDAQPATDRVVGSVAELWRYPVKSMRGGTVSQLLITDRGSVGDRAWALRDPTSGRIASAKRFPRLLEFRATYEVEPTMTTPGRVRIEAPDGQTVYADEPAAWSLSRASSVAGCGWRTSRGVMRRLASTGVRCSATCRSRR